MHTYRHSLSRVYPLSLAFVLIFSGVLPLAGPPAPLQAAPPSQPPTSTSVIATPPQPPGRELSSQGIMPPAPEAGPAEGQVARAQQPTGAALQNHLDYWGPRYQAAPLDVQVAGEWTHDRAQWASEEQALSGALHILTWRLPDGGWEAAAPDSDKVHFARMEKVPVGLVPSGKKGQLHHLATAPDASWRSQANLASDTLPNVLSNGQFVYGPNVGAFNMADFFADSAPHLARYAEDLYGRSEYYSINPKVYLALIEMTTHLISNQQATIDQIERPFGLEEPGFLAQADSVSAVMNRAYYLHLYEFSPLAEGSRDLPGFVLTDGTIFAVPPTVNAGTYAVIAALAQLRDAAGLLAALDLANPRGFYQTYVALFPGDDPLSESNHIYIPGEISAFDVPPGNMLQLAYLRGESWKFNGVHSAQGDQGSDMSSIDFSPGWPGWGADTSNMWVTAAADGVPTKISACNFKIAHSDGWEIVYYHLENIQNLGGSIQQNDRIGVIANTYAEATCNGGDSTGPHVHFTLKRNGAWVALNGTALSGWVVHSGRSNYDTDRDYMWLERDGTKKYVNDLLLNDHGSVPVQPPMGEGTWEARYFNGDTCWNDHNQCNKSRCETLADPPGTVLLDKSWGAGSPGCDAGDDNWTGYFNTNISFPSGDYVFYADHDDGLKLKVDNYGEQSMDSSGSADRICYNTYDVFKLNGDTPLHAYLREDAGDAKIKLWYSTDTSVCPLRLNFTTPGLGNNSVKIVVTSPGDPNNQLSQPAPVTTDSQGSKAVDLDARCVTPGDPDGYDVYAKPDGYFRQKTLQPVLVQRPQSYVVFDRPFLIDEKNDNVYGIGELLKVLSYWGSSNLALDYDRSGGTIGTGDLLYVLRNWGGPGDGGWADTRPLMCGASVGSAQRIIEAQDATGSMILTPDTGTLNVGDTFDMQVLMDTGGHAADSVNMIVLYDSGVLAVQDTEPLTAGTQISAGSIFPHIITNTAQSSLGEIRYSADGNAFSGSGTLASITFTVTSAIHNTAVEVYYRDGWIGESNIVESGTLSDVLGYANAASFQTIGSPSRPMPTVSFTPASNALVNTSMIQLEAQATDPYSQVREVKFEINLNGIWTTIARDTYRPYWRYLWDASSVPDGVYAIRATALLLGGEGTTATNSNIWLDRTLPRYVSSKIVPPPGPYIGGPVEINAAAADEGSGVDHIDVYARKAEGSSWYFLGSISGGQGDVIWDTSGYSAGTYQIAFSIQDRAGNWGPASQPQHFIKLEAEHKVYLPVVLKNSDGPAPPPVPTPPPTPSSNLLINGSFEDGTYAPDASPDGWTQDAWNWSRVAFLWDDTQAHTGNRSIRITHNDLNDSRWIQTVPVQPNTDYHLSGWIKTENVAHANELVDAGANLSVFGTFTYIGELFGTNDWTYVSLVFNSGDNANVTIAARLGYWAGTTTGTVWFDDLRLEPL